MTLTVLTPERRALLARDWPAGRDSRAIAVDWDALPGKKLNPKTLSRFAHHLGLRRPAGYKPSAQHHPNTKTTPERDALLRRDWPDGVDIDVLFDALAALPGAPVTRKWAQRRAADLGLKRTPEYRSALNAKMMSAALAERRANAPPPKAKRTPAPPPADADAMISAYIAAYGVTRCPAAALLPTTATISAADQAVIAAHGDPVWRANQKRMRHAA